MKAGIILLVLSIVALVLQLVSETLLSVVMVKLNVLPDKYLVVLFIVLGCLAVLTAGLMFIRVKKPVSMVRRIISCVLALLVVAGCLYVENLASQAYRTIEQVTQTVEFTDMNNMYIFARVDDPAQTVAETGDYAYGIIADYDEDRIQMTLAMVEEKTGKAVSVTGYEMTAQLADALLGGQVDVALMNGAIATLLMEEANYDDFLNKVKILDAIPLSQLEIPEPTVEETTVPEEETDEPEVERTITNTPFIVYLSGSDTRSSKLKISRSDVNILVIVNPVSKQILLLNTPRDYYVANPAGKGRLDKLTNCGLYGPENSMETLENLYNLKIDYYAHINFDGFETLVDAVGGVTIYSDKRIHLTEGGYINVGENELDGKKALALARERYHVSGGDNGRGQNQMKVITAIIKKMTTGTTIIANYTNILKSLEGTFRTDVSMDEITMLVKMQLNDMAQWNIKSYASTGRHGNEKTYSSPGHTAYVMHPNKDSVAHATTLVDRVIAGEILTDEDMVIPK